MKLYFVTIAIILALLVTKNQCVDITFYPYYNYKETAVTSDNHEKEVYIVQNDKILPQFDENVKKNIEISNGQGDGEYVSLISTYSQVTKFRIWAKDQDKYEPNISIKSDNIEKSYMIKSIDELQKEYNFVQNKFDDEQDGFYFYILWENYSEIEKDFALYTVNVDINEKKHYFHLQKQYKQLDSNPHFKMRYYDFGLDEVIPIEKKVIQTEGDWVDLLVSVDEGSQIIEDAYLISKDKGDQFLPDYVVNQYQDLEHRFILKCPDNKNPDPVTIQLRFRLYGYQQDQVDLTFQRDCSKGNNGGGEEEEEQEVLDEVGQDEQKPEDQKENNYTQKIKDKKTKRDGKKKNRPDWAKDDAHKTIREENRNKNVQSWEVTKDRQSQDAGHYIKVKKGRCRQMKQQKMSEDTSSRDFLIVNHGQISKKWLQNKNDVRKYDDSQDIAYFCIYNQDLSQKNGNIYFKPRLIPRSKDSQKFFKPQIQVKSIRKTTENTLIEKGYYLLKGQQHSELQLAFNCNDNELGLKMELQLYHLLTDSQEDSEDKNKSMRIIKLPIEKDCVLPEEFENDSESILETYVFYFLCAIGIFIGFKSVMCLKSMIKADNDVHEQAELQKTKRKYDKIDQLPDSSIVFRN